jgi:hypothetical protein
LLNGVYIYFDVLPYNAYTRSSYPFIDTIGLFGFLRASPYGAAKTRSIRSVNILKFKCNKKKQGAKIN